MNTLIRTAAFAAITLIGGTNAFAIGSLPECYDRVIASCNKGNHAQSCANSGMNQCDKVFPNPIIYKPGLGLSAVKVQPENTSNQRITDVSPR